MNALRAAGTRRASPFSMHGSTTSALLAASAALLSACRVSVEATPAPNTQHLAAEGALGPYSAAVGSGDLVFLSGKIGARPAPSSDADFAAEAHAAFDAIDRDLARLGLDTGDVLYATVYLTDMARYADLNAVYAARMKQPYPARACVAVSALPAGARVEIAVVARRR